MLYAAADTHTVIWHLFADSRLSGRAHRTIEEAAANGDQIAFSSITLAEIVYLSEKGRIHPDTLARLLEAIGQEEALLYEVPFDRNVAAILTRVDRLQVPDLPDRIIAATSL